MTEQEMQAEIGKINAKNNEIIAQFQADNDRKLKGLITEAAFNDLKAGYDKRMAEVDLELAKLKKPHFDSSKLEADAEAELKHKAFANYLRKGPERLEPPEQKVLQLGQTTYAGVLAPYEYVQQIIKGITLFSPMRPLCTVRTTTNYSVKIPRQTAIGVATWVAETVEKTETTGLTYDLPEVKLFSMKCLYEATQEMLEDSSFNLEAEIAEAVGKAFGVLEGTAFISGNGTTAPSGILTTITGDSTYGINQIAQANASIIATDIFNMYYGLAEAYVPRATWACRRATTSSIMQLKNATTGTYILVPSLTAAEPARILGCPLVEMPDIPAWADEAACLLFGDFRAAYTIVDRIDIQIQRLVEKYAELGEIGFLARKRVGGLLILPEAMRVLYGETS